MYIIKAYAAVGVMQTISVPNICVETNIAKVPFCNPHSKAIHFCCFIPEARVLPR